jgi:hypothetical protein
MTADINNRAFQSRPAILGANEEKGAPDSAGGNSPTPGSLCSQSAPSFTGPACFQAGGEKKRSVAG